MDHLDDIRLMELAIDSTCALEERETSHLETCATCSARLADELKLNGALEDIAPHPVPSEFMARATARYVHAAAAEIHPAPYLLAGIVLTLVLSGAMMWLILANPSVFLSNLIVVFSKAATVVRAMHVVVSRVPNFVEIVTLSSGVTVLLCTGLLANLVKRSSVAVKYSPGILRISE